MDEKQLTNEREVGLGEYRSCVPASLASGQKIAVKIRPNDLLSLGVLVLRYVRQAYLHFRLKRHGVRLAPTAMVVGRCTITGDVEIGPETVVLGSLLDGRGGVVIGRKVIINWATIVTAQHNLDSPTFETTCAPVIIGNYVVLFSRSLVLPGRRIGMGAVVAAGAVVAHDVPDMAVVAGNPARVVRYRTCVHTDADLRRSVGFAPRRLMHLSARLQSWWSQRWKEK